MPPTAPADWFNNITTYHWLLLITAAVIIGIAKTGFPGVGILAVPLAAMVIPAKQSTGVVLPMLLLADCIAVLYYRQHAVMKYLVRLIPCAAAGIIIGTFFMGRVSDAQLKPIIGAVILILLLITWWRMWRKAKNQEPHVPHAWWFPVVMGLLAGVVTMMANAAGPIIGLYLIAMSLPKHGFLGTGAWFTLTLNAFKIPFSAGLIKVPFSPPLHLITHDTLLLNLKLAPVILTGAFLGLWLVKFVPEKVFTIMVHVLTAVAALQLLSTLYSPAAPPENPAPASHSATTTALQSPCPAASAAFAACTSRASRT